MLLLYLDPYHLGDPLFLTQLARDLAHRGTGAVLVHGSGEAAERALEATGAIVRQRDGVWSVETPEQAAIVERAARELNRQIVHELNEVGVPAIRVIGADRGLLKMEGEGVDAGSTTWVADLVAQGVVGVVAALVDCDKPALSEVNAVEASGALAHALGVASVTLLESRTRTQQPDTNAPRIARLRERDVGAEVIPRTELRVIS